MLRRFHSFVRPLGAICSLLVAVSCAHAIRGYGVDADSMLFDFDVDSPNPAPVHVDGNVGFLPEGIDFRPSTKVLYAIDVGSATTQLYTINIATGAATKVGAGFPSSVPGSYSITPSSRYGFDFDPTSLAADGSMQIRLVNTSGVNMRINSLTGLVAGVDTQLVIPPGAGPFVDGIAYSNNIARMGGPTTLFDTDTRSDSVYFQNPPNSGQLTLLGSFGVGDDAVAPSSFDIYTSPDVTDPEETGDRGLSVFQRPQAPTGGVSPLGSYLLYEVDLSNGAMTMGRVVGVPATPANFDGGFAVLPSVPEPSSIVLAAFALIGVPAACLAQRRGSARHRPS